MEIVDILAVPLILLFFSFFFYFGSELTKFFESKSKKKQVKNNNKGSKKPEITRKNGGTTMGFFSRKITSGKVIEALGGLFSTCYGQMSDGLKDSLQLKSLSKIQEAEVAFVLIVALDWAIVSALGDAPKIANILDGANNRIFYEHFLDNKAVSDAKKLYQMRYVEYGRALDPQNKDLATQVGQIFCTHFFGKEEDDGNFGTIMLVGMVFLSFTKEVKQFLDEISSHYEIV